MKIQYNKVTWYSKLLAAIVILGLLPTLTFYVGIQYEHVRALYVPVGEILPRTKITQSQAEAIAEPILKKCLNGGPDKYTINSVSTALILDENNGPKGPVWNVGGNYSSKDFSTIYHTYGTVPEVYINAFTGEVMDRHFSEIGAADGGKECNN